MDAQGAIEAEADLEAHFRQRQLNRSQSGRGLQKAQDAMAIAAGAVNSDANKGESSPLLGDPERSSGASDVAGTPSLPETPFPEWPGASDYDGLPWYKKPSIIWMLPPFFLFALAFGSVIVPKVNLVKDLICRDYLAGKALMDPDFHYEPIKFGQDNGNLCRTEAVEGRTSLFMMGDSVLGGLLTAITSPYIGAMADRYGRTRIIAITSMGGILKEIFSIFAANYMETFPVGLLYIGFIADGLCGSFVAGMAVAHAYASDTVHPLKRKVAFGFFHICLFLGIAIGPLIGGYVIERTGTLLTMFYVAFACHLFFVFFVLLVIPESLPKYRQKAAREKYEYEMSVNGRETILTRLRPSKFFAPLKVLYPRGEGSSPELRRNLVLLCTIDTTMFGVAMGALNIFILYTDYQFHWGQLEQSKYVSIVNITRVLCLFLLLPAINRFARGRGATNEPEQNSGCDKLDLGLIRTGVAIDTLGFLGMTLVRTGDLFILAGSFAALGGIAAPTLQSAETKHVPHHRVGQLLGATGMLHSLAKTIAPLLFSLLFYATIGKFNQAVFLFLTVGFFFAWILTWFVKPGIQLKESIEHSEAD